MVSSARAIDYAILLPRPVSKSTTLTIACDSNWAGCRRTRKSTTCFIIWVGHMMLTAQSKTQGFHALSSGEAEWYAATSGAAEGLYIMGLLTFFGWELEARVFSDSSAARGIAGRQGVGKVRTLETRTLWLQAKVREGLVKVLAIAGKKNPADLGTKALGSQRIQTLAAKAGVVVSVRGESIRHLVGVPPTEK